jgi:hypothetical protein
MAISDSHVFADGDTDYVANLNHIRTEAVANAAIINTSTGAITGGAITASSVATGTTSLVSTESLRAHKTGANGGGATSAIVVRMTNDAKTAGDTVGLNFGALSSTDVNVSYAGIKTVIANSTNGAHSGHLAFYTVDAATLTEAARFTNARNFLINMSVDDTVNKLQVTGGTALTGNLTFIGSARRIQGDFSGSLTNRAFLQTSTTNGDSNIGLITNGTGTASSYQAFNTSSPTNSSYIHLGVTSTASIVRSGIAGTGTQLPLDFQIASTTHGRLFTSGNWGVGSTTDDGLNKLQVTGGVAINGDLTISGSTRRILADFSSATATRATFQTSTTNGSTTIGVIPNGTGTQAFSAWSNSSSTTNFSRMFLGADTSIHRINSDALGSGTVNPIEFQISGVPYGKLFNTGRWAFGASPTDDGVSAVSINGAASVTGNITLSGTTRRIIADFSNATNANRTAFQTSTTDGVTVVSAIPNGTATQAIMRVWNTSGVATGASGSLGVSSAAVYIDSGTVGAGTNLPIQFMQLGTARGSLFTSGRWYLGATPVDDGSSTLQVNGITKTAGLTSISPTSGIGYGTGAGGTVTQATSKSTGVTLNTLTGAITMHAASLAANTAVSFTFTNSNIAVTDVVKVMIKSGATADSYLVYAETPTAGTCKIGLRNLTAGALAEAVVITFIIYKGAVS